MCVWESFSYSRSLSAGRTNYTGGLFPKKWSPVIPSQQSKQTLTSPPGSSMRQCQMSFPGVLPLNFHFTTQLVPARVSVPRTGHRGGQGTRLPVSHSPPSAAWDTTEPGTCRWPLGLGAKPQLRFINCVLSCNFPDEAVVLQKHQSWGRNVSFLAHRDNHNWISS